jgi:hypothetical protein
MNRRRLEAEEIRDSVLAVSGLLNPQMSGPPVALQLSREEMEGIREPNLWPTNIDPAQQNRRSVYLFVKRAFRLPMFEVFDSPDTAQSCARRDVSTVAPQALTLLNSGFTQSAAQALAARTAREPDPVQAIWRSALGRAPDSAEKSRADGFLKKRSLAELSLLVLNLNEFLYVD